MDDIKEEKAEEKKEVVPDPKIEQRAKLQGWTPKEDFRGDPERWITAEQFVERADTMMPIMRAQNKKYEKQLSEIQQELKDQKKLTKKMIAIHGKYSQETYDSKIAEIKIQKSQAVEDGNVELYNKLEAQEEKITAPETIKVEEEDTKQKDSPIITKWKDENSQWYGKDEELTEYADIIATKMGQKGHSYGEYEFCEAVKEKVKKMFPDKFRNPNARAGSGVDEPDTRGGEDKKNKKMSWTDLDKDAKGQCAELMATIPGYTKEKYMKDYMEA